MDDLTPSQIRYSRINEESQYCQYCSTDLDNTEQCDHDSTTEHLSCLDCCKAFNPEDYNPHTGELLRRYS